MLSINKNLVDSIVFVDKHSTYEQGSLQNMFSMIFKKKDLSLFDYSILKWEILSNEQKMVYGYLKTSNVITYKALGERFGFHQRKIAYLMKMNPFVYVVPCHRVIAKNSIGGYKFSVELKKALLDFEKNM